MRFFLQGSKALFPVLMVAISALLSGCLAGKTNNQIFLAGEASLPFVRGLMSTLSYQQEMTRWQAVLQKNAAPKEEAGAHLHLAALYLAKDNLQKDYQKAYVELTRATTVWPDLRENRGLASWLELLERFEGESQNGKKDNADHENELVRAQQKIVAQQQEIAQLRETLDKLKRLEVSVEKKRRAFK